MPQENYTISFKLEEQEAEHFNRRYLAQAEQMSKDSSSYFLATELVVASIQMKRSNNEISFAQYIDQLFSIASTNKLMIDDAKRRNERH